MKCDALSPPERFVRWSSTREGTSTAMHRLNQRGMAWSSDRLDIYVRKHVDTFKPTMPGWVVEHRDWVTAERKSQARVARHRFKAKTSLRRSSWKPAPDTAGRLRQGDGERARVALREGDGVRDEERAVARRQRARRQSRVRRASEILRKRKDESFGALLNSSSYE